MTIDHDWIDDAVVALLHLSLHDKCRAEDASAAEPDDDQEAMDA